MSDEENEGTHWQATRIGIWLGIFAATAGFWAATGAIVFRLLR